MIVDIVWTIAAKQLYIYLFSCLFDNVSEGNLLHFLLHGVLDVHETVVEYIVDMAADGAGGVWVLMKTEEGLTADALYGTEDVGERDVCEFLGDVCAALASACDGDEPRATELTEDAADDDGMYADAPRERFARRWLVFAEEIDTDEDVDGDGEAA